MIKYPPPRPNVRMVMDFNEDGTTVCGCMSTSMIPATKDTTKGRLVIVEDSLGDSMIGHLRPSYSEIVRIHHGADFFDINIDEVLSYEPDAVLLAISERQAARKGRPFMRINARLGR